MTEVPMPTILAETADTVTISRADLDALFDALEDAEDLAAVAANRAQEDQEPGGPEAARAGYLAWDDWERIRAGAPPVLVWRERRGLSQAELARAAGVGQGYLSDIERGKKPGSADALRKLAGALGVGMDDLVPSSRGLGKAG